MFWHGLKRAHPFGLACMAMVMVGCTHQVEAWGEAGAGEQVDAGGTSAQMPRPSGPVPVDGGSGDAGLVAPVGEDAGATPTPGAVDAGPPSEPNGCSIWSDCAPFFGDPNSGYACENSQCICDPTGNAHQNCISSGGTFLEVSCYCEVSAGPEIPPDVGGSCQSWEDCAPHYGDQNSGFECISQVCTCDPQSAYAGRCAEYGGYWVIDECFCAFADVAPPGEAEEDCYWRWDAPPCDPDRWVDTSHYECRYDERNELRCDVWVQSGYWEDGACPTGHWEQLCY